MKPCCVAYIPPPSISYAEAFLRNITKFKPKHDLILYSEHPWPGVKGLAGTPEAIKNERDRQGRAKEFALSNLVFYTGMGLANAGDYTHALYVEADSRVGCEHWDERIFAEYLKQPIPQIIGGSVVLQNPANSGIDGQRRADELIRKNTRRNFPIPIYGNKGALDNSGSCVFCNGSGTVIDLAWYKLLFTEEERSPEVQDAPRGHQFGLQRRSQSVYVENGNGGANGFWAMKLARESRPWDVELGTRIWQKFGADAYDVIANLSTVYSSYGDVLTKEAERLAMLKNGVALVHQVKSNAEI